MAAATPGAAVPGAGATGPGTAAGPVPASVPASVAALGDLDPVALLAEIADVGRAAGGGWSRLVHTDAELTLRDWFTEHATRLGLDVETDRNGNLWAWWGADLPGADEPGAVLQVGSHLDSVPAGGAYDGPLGVVSALAAVSRLRAEGFRPHRPVVVPVFAEEEGGRFGIACAGSRLMTGALDPARAGALADPDGVTAADAARRVGADPAAWGPDPVRVARIGEAVELHVEQGHLPTSGGCRHGALGLAEAGAPLGLLTEIWPHGRWRFDLVGEGNHAGTTPLDRRTDPMLALAEGVLAARRAAERHGVLATVGKVRVDPGAVNAIPSAATFWLDARGADPVAVDAAVAEVAAALGTAGVRESWTPVTRFDAGLGARLAGPVRVALAAAGAPAGADGRPLLPSLPSGAGHDAGVLAEAGVPTAMLVVRNPSGISHAPGEHAEDDDARLGAAALVEIIRDRAGSGWQG
ncbi:allantoate amidohydrolase [Actinotalea sp. M2MS4P-6]|uniref:allantoate amidohydrolase n=1 Tax=Actinotalea sp. M2MS4P-6 TaxID=2983762 RepID=UPI0021E4F41A|nr:allantoate amidohydrolase [Actinotalea sp. M2MS4P-6]MCV2394364.1 allantoate amidohydrolase [Actinotalea sp. M2MS4P-6]